MMADQMTFDELESDEVFGYVYRDKGRSVASMPRAEKNVLRR